MKKMKIKGYVYTYGFALKRADNVVLHNKILTLSGDSFTLENPAKIEKLKEYEVIYIRTEHNKEIVLHPEDLVLLNKVSLRAKNLKVGRKVLVVAWHTKGNVHASRDEIVDIQVVKSDIVRFKMKPEKAVVINGFFVKS